MAAPLIVRGVRRRRARDADARRPSFRQSDVDTLQTCAQLIAPVVVNAQLLPQPGPVPGERDRATPSWSLAGGPLAHEMPPRPERNVGGLGHSDRARRRDRADLPAARPARPPEARVHARVRIPRPRSATFSRAPRGAPRARRDARGHGVSFGPEFAAVFHTHVQILEDKGFVGKLRRRSAPTQNALAALRNVLDAYRETFERIEDPYFRDRAVDVEEVGRRVMERLLGVRYQTAPMPEGAIVVADHILPSYFARLDLHKVAAFVSEHGGATSHGAIFARTLEIPAVTGVAAIRDLARDGELAIVDGGEGIVYLSPDEAILGEYERTQRRYVVAIQHLDAMRDRPGQTRDGRRIALTANVGLASDLRLVEQHGAEGVGLFRTELLALVQRGHPEEEEQEQLYERVARALAPRPVTIRTLDLGGDKDPAAMGMGAEENPQLGCRSIRLSFEHEGVFRAQLRAILRASALGNVRLLLPMISSLSELRRARALIEDVKREMRLSGSPLDERIPVGVMIEVPSAALTADALARGATSSASEPTTSPSTHSRWTARTSTSRASTTRCTPRCWRSSTTACGRHRARGSPSRSVARWWATRSRYRSSSAWASPSSRGGGGRFRW